MVAESLWVGLSLTAPPFAALAWWAATAALFGTNLVLLDRGVPVAERVAPTIAAGMGAALIVVGWELGNRR